MLWYHKYFNVEKNVDRAEDKEREETLNIKENEENSNYNDLVKFMNVS